MSSMTEKSTAGAQAQLNILDRTAGISENDIGNMEVKRICQWCGKPFIAQKTTTCYCSPQCSKRGYKHRIKERKMELRHIQEMQELRSSLEKQEYFTFSQAARLMGVSRQYIYKLVKEDKLRASRISCRS